jgi:glycosyltransferase involved in cell wall biosynthesis
MGAFLRPSVVSALQQNFSRPYEVIVVDDCSTDNSLETIADLKVKIVKQKENGGVARARNAGVVAAKGRYCCCLDGDDRLAPSYLSDLVPIIESSRQIGVVAPKWGTFDEAGKLLNGPLGDDGEVAFAALKTGNQIPCASLFRKRAWRGQNSYINPSWEDYEGWLSIGEAGWKIVNDSGKTINFLYTVKTNAGRNYDSRNDAPRLRAVVNAFHPRLYRPTVSVVIPVYSHPELAGEAIESVLKQTWQDFEIIVVNDGMPPERRAILDETLATYRNDPWVKVADNIKNLGLAAARNTGVYLAKGEYIFPLDDDDTIDPPLLERAVAEQRRAGGNVIVYCDYYTEPGKPIALPDYNFDALIVKDHIPSSALFPKAAWEKVRGYLEEFRTGMEDWDFWIRLGVAGYCGVRIPEAWLFYRQHPEGSMRSKMIREHLNETKALMVQRNIGLFRGVKPMGCCGNRSLAPIPPTPAITAQAEPNGNVWMKYKGNKSAPVSVGGYLVSASHPYILVKPQDVQPLLNLQLFKIETPK